MFWYHGNENTVLLEKIIGELYIVQQKLGKIMTAQQDIDAATAELTSVVNDVATNVDTLVNTDIPAIQAEIAALQNQGVDTSALNNAVASAQNTASSLDSAVSNVGSLVPPPSA